MTSFIFLAIGAVVLMLLFLVFASVWVYRDARQRGLPAGMWVLIVVLSGTFIGLILYLLVGRKQERAICGNCGLATDTRGAFCSACGERLVPQERRTQTSKGLLIACAVCILLAFAALGLCLVSALRSDGFAFESSYSLYHYGTSGSAKNVSQNSSGGTWELSFEETSEGYAFSKTYNAAAQPLMLDLDIQGSGTVRLVITQDGISIDETIGTGGYSYDMSAFKPGRIDMKIINEDAASFSGTLEMTTN